jgi:hypothetical protein
VPCSSQRCAPIIEPAMKLPLLVMDEATARASCANLRR